MADGQQAGATCLPVQPSPKLHQLPVPPPRHGRFASPDRPAHPTSYVIPMSCSSVCSTAPSRSGSSSAVGAAGGQQDSTESHHDTRHACLPAKTGRHMPAASSRCRHMQAHATPASCACERIGSRNDADMWQPQRGAASLTCRLHLCQRGVSKVHGAPLQETTQVGLADAACVQRRVRSRPDLCGSAALAKAPDEEMRKADCRRSSTAPQRHSARPAAWLRAWAHQWG